MYTRMEVCSKILNSFIIISVLLNENNFIESYSQVSRVGAISNNNNNNNTNSAIIKHNPGREGVSSSDNVENNKTMSEYNDDEIATIENKSTEVFTGRSSSSSSSMAGFQFPMNFNTKPISYRRPSMAKSSSSPLYVYPSYGSKSIDQTYTYSNNVPPPSGPAIAMDRFSPGEAYGFQQHLKNKKNNGYNYLPPKSRIPDKPASSAAAAPPPAMIKPAAPPVLPTAPPSPVGPVYQAPKDLYAFPPNVGANYLPPYMKANERPVTSYLPPAAGVPDDFGSNSFVGPINPKYLPSSNSQSMPPGMSPQDMPPGMSPQDMPPSMSSQDMPPGMMMSDSGSMEMENHDHDHSHDHDHDHSHDHPPPMMGPSSGDEMNYHDHHNHDHDHYHDHDHSHDMPPSMMSDTPPPPPAPTTESPLTQMMAVVMEALKNNKNNSPPPPPSSPPSAPTNSDISFSSPDHDHFPYHDHDHDYHGQHGVDVFPEVIYDHDPHDHHHDIVTTTTPAPPEDHMESRVKKYSYYYLGRKLWYIPLYFTLYFSFYVAALIMRSIGRHKVQWPNHYQKRSIDDISHKETVRKVEKLTRFVMNSIEDFNEKYL